MGNKNIILALDADLAGQEAAFRGVEVLTHSLDKKITSTLSWSKELASSVDKGMAPSPSLAGLVKHQSILDAEIKIMILPPGKDPDEVISEDSALWQSLVEQALPVLDFALETVISKVDINKAKDKSLAVQKLLPLIYEIKDLVQQGHYVRKLADTLKIRECLLLKLSIWAFLHGSLYGIKTSSMPKFKQNRLSLPKVLG